MPYENLYVRISAELKKTLDQFCAEKEVSIREVVETSLKKHLRKEGCKVPYKLNQDWEEFEPALRAELQKLGATEGEIEKILDGAWQAATDVDDVARYATDELDLLWDPDMPDYKN